MHKIHSLVLWWHRPPGTLHGFKHACSKSHTADCCHFNNGSRACHALLHVASDCLTHWTTWAGFKNCHISKIVLGSLETLCRLETVWRQSLHHVGLALTVLCLEMKTVQSTWRPMRCITHNSLSLPAGWSIAILSLRQVFYRLKEPILHLLWGVMKQFFMATLSNRAGHYILSCGFFFYLLLLLMAALRSRCGHYIFILWFLLSSSFFFFFSLPNLSGCRVDVNHTPTHRVALVCI